VSTSPKETGNPLFYTRLRRGSPAKTPLNAPKNTSLWVLSGIPPKFQNARMAGLRINNQKNAIAVTVIIVTAFKICISHRKKWALESPADES
jgi:hypothetical protein